MCELYKGYNIDLNLGQKLGDLYMNATYTRVIMVNVTDLWTTPVGVWHLLVEWRGPSVDQRARMPARWTPPPKNGGADNNNRLG